MILNVLLEGAGNPVMVLDETEKTGRSLSCPGDARFGLGTDSGRASGGAHPLSLYRDILEEKKLVEKVPEALTEEAILTLSMNRPRTKMLIPKPSFDELRQTYQFAVKGEKPILPSQFPVMESSLWTLLVIPVEW